MKGMKYLNPIIMTIVLGVIFSGCVEEKKSTLPDDLPEFVLASDFDIIDWERKAIEFEDMIGNLNIVGVIGADMPSISEQKWMWHLWGIDEIVNNDLTVVGYHKETETVHPILQTGNDNWSIPLAGEHNGADAHTPSSVKFAKEGEWALLLYVNNELFDILVMDINE
ncbi:hypothetical protein [Ureibacillus acetophenoni]|uniref:DUF4871 domain-containing protein n=1 Tax=Ureibacillus acetophenoni TaxID=614649 RepID=A0A285UCU8_9BACL|nr:hypothetical protein [Ureibacillus acetophenoni]SOC39619.1 hypothetical protein SAMN05877842_10631 [Ureibacillus acetophenoni]